MSESSVPTYEEALRGLAEINEILNVPEWSSDTAPDIADVMHRLGYRLEADD